MCWTDRRKPHGNMTGDVQRCLKPFSVFSREALSFILLEHTDSWQSSWVFYLGCHFMGSQHLCGYSHWLGLAKGGQRETHPKVTSVTDSTVWRHMQMNVSALKQHSIFHLTSHVLRSLLLFLLPLDLGLTVSILSWVLPESLVNNTR